MGIKQQWAEKILNDIDLHLQLNPEFVRNWFLDFLSELKDFCAGGVAMVDEDEGLLFMATYIAFPIAFPSGLLDKPTGSQFEIMPEWKWNDTGENRF